MMVTVAVPCGCSSTVNAVLAHATGKAKEAQQGRDARVGDGLVVNGRDHPGPERIAVQRHRDAGVLDEIEVLVERHSEQLLDLRGIEARAIRAGRKAVEELPDEEADLGSDLAHLDICNGAARHCGGQAGVAVGGSGWQALPTRVLGAHLERQVI